MDPKKPSWIIVSLILMAMIFIKAPLNSEIEGSEKISAPSTVDTFIPQGYVLVTLQLINADSVDSMIGNYGMVDLYSANNDQNSSGKKIELPLATRLRLIRAPNNPNLFGVLVQEHLRDTIHKLSEPVFAVIQGPNTKSQSEQRPSKQKKSRLIYYGDFL